MSNSKDLTIQTVVGLISKTPGIQKSHKYTGDSRWIRSNGIYAFKDYDGQIVTGFATNGYNFAENEMQDQLNAFQSFARTQGFEFAIAKGRNWEFMITRKV